MRPPARPFICASCRSSQLQTRKFTSRAPPAAPPPPAGLVSLSSRRLISLAGPDAPKFLQGVITQSILAAPSSSVRTDGFYSAFLTATGRVLHDVFIYPVLSDPDFSSAAAPGESFLIEVDADEAARLERHIKRYKLRARFAVRLLAPDEMTVWHAWDAPDGRAALDAASQGVEDFHRVAQLRDPRAGGSGSGFGWRMIKRGEREPLVDVPRVHDEDVYRVRRYLFGVPEGQREIVRESALPLEANLDVMGGVDFRKGCYVGQELTIRTKHRGVVRKRILPVVVYGEGEEEPAQLEYRPGVAAAAAAAAATGAADASEIPAETSIGRVEKKGRSAGKWLRGVGNVGLALCRLEIMTDVVLPGETAAASYKFGDEFVMEQPPQQEAGVDGFKVKVKAFVPDWLRQGLDQQDGGH